MKTLRRISSRINNVFIQAILVVFYFIAIGTAFILHIIARRPVRRDTYWTDAGKAEVILPSPY